MSRKKNAAPPATPPSIPIDEAVRRVKRAVRRMRKTTLGEYAENNEATPYQILVSCIISLRTKDAVTAAASRRLFARAATPADMLALKQSDIAKLIYPAGFYNQKSGQIRDLSQVLLEEFGGRVPDTIDELLTLKGVGRKTANLVVTIGHNKPGICVDTHVHRIVNRWDFVQTKTPDKTEMALRDVLPHRHWIPINDLLVTWGQNVCTPQSPRCSTCELEDICPKVGVSRRR